MTYRLQHAFIKILLKHYGLDYTNIVKVDSFNNYMTIRMKSGHTYKIDLILTEQ